MKLGCDYNKRLARNIERGLFSFQLNDRMYYGYMINVMPLFCSYGQIGYVITTPFGQLKYDYELNKIDISDVNEGN